MSQDQGNLLLVESICPYCQDTGWEFITEGGGGVRPCRCRAGDRRESLLNAARIPKRYEKCSFHTFDASASLEHKRVLMRLQRWVKDFPVVEHGWLLTGPCGVGKTHLAVSVIRELIEAKEISCLFYEFGDLLKKIQDSYNPVSEASELKVLEPLYSVDVLVLDELGATKPTDWVRDTMMQVINRRYNDHKVTIFTSNYADDRRTERDETLTDRIGARLRSRLYEMCEIVAVEGADYRLKLREERNKRP